MDGDMTMMLDLEPNGSNFERNVISPMRELGAYEALWTEAKASFKTLSDKFAEHPGAVPSDFVPPSKAKEYADTVESKFRSAKIERFGVRVHGAGDYPEKLRDAANPIELLYYQGDWGLVESRCVAVVGTRNPTDEGMARTRLLVRKLVKDGYTIVSGLAKGVDTVAHETALAEGGKTIAVIGTPLSHTYPNDNTELQQRIAKDFLVISQVPVLRWEAQDYRRNRGFFPERNVTMSALTEATVIVEAGETSGTLIQARAALKQRRLLFILESCFLNKALTWPQRFADQGAIRVKDYNDVKQHLSKPSNAD